MRVAQLLCLPIVSVLATSAASADPVEQFYRGKTMQLLIGVSAGGEYDTHARLVGRFLGRYLPGKPNIVPQNMLGAGGITMANYLYNQAPRDGSYFAVIQNGHPMIQVLGLPNIQYDAGRFGWIGAITPTVETMAIWRTAGVRNVNDAREKGEIVVGSVGRANITYTFPQMLNEFVGTNFKIVSGYRGGNEINLAMERNEVLGRNNTWSSWKTTRPAWLKNREIEIIAYAGPKPADLPGVPALEDLAQSEDDKTVIRLLTSGSRLGRPMATTPDTPPDRLKALRAAFDAAVKDAEFLQEAQNARIEVDPVSGEELHKVVQEVLATPERLRGRARSFLQ